MGEDILSVATLPIALNQVMYHVGMGMSPNLGSDYKDYCESVGIVYMSFSTLCGPCDGNDKTELLTGPLVTEIGRAQLQWEARAHLIRCGGRGSPCIASQF